MDEKKTKILIVEDDDDTREMIVSALQRHGASVLEVSSGSEALTKLREGNPDVLVSDIGMHEMDGYDLLKRIRVGLDGVTKDLPAIALTAYASSEDIERTRRAGFAVHIAKPISVSELLYSIAKVVQTR